MRYLMPLVGSLALWVIADWIITEAGYRRWRSLLLPMSHNEPRKPAACLLTALDKLGWVCSKWIRRPTMVSLEAALTRAGLTWQVSPYALLGVKVLAAASGCGMGLLGSDLRLAVVSGIVWFFVPDLYLATLHHKRQQHVQKALPRVIDLMMVATEAGLSFEEALDVVSGFADQGPLYAEMGRVLQEIRLGQSQEQALRALARRVDHPDVTSFVLTLIQGQKLGTPIGRILGVVANQVRVKRAADAEAEAGKAPIKIMFPLLLFVFPSLLLVLLGPVLLRDQF